MSYVPGCRYDLFISYASANNRDGWVEQFEKALGYELNQLIGNRFIPKESIFFDRRRLEAGQSFSDELTSAARESAILLPVLSPGYLTSSWCNRERTDFFAKLPHGATPESCLSPVLLRPIDEDLLNDLYRTAQRMSFLSADDQTPVPTGSVEWTDRIKALAAQLKKALQKLRFSCKPVFIGMAANNVRSQNLREWCCAELESRFFRTIPETFQAAENIDFVTTNLREAGLAVHFLGGADEAMLQAIEISSTACTGPTILYQPFGEDLTTDEALFLKDFERQLPATCKLYQRLEGKHDQELLALIDEQITRPMNDAATSATPAHLALVCEESDLEGVRQIKEAIRAQHPMEIDFPGFLEGRMKAMERLRKWREFLTRSQALVFYYGLAGREQLEGVWQKAEQENAGAARSWFVAPPDLEAKRLKHPDALWNIDQVIALLQQARDEGHL